MEHLGIPDLWNRIVHLPLRLANPQTGASLLVYAKPATSSDPTVHMDLPSEVIDALGLPFGKTIGHEQDEDGLAPAWPIKANEVSVTLGQFTFRAVARTMRHTAEVRAFPAVMHMLPAHYDLSRFLPVRPHPKVFMSYSHQDKRFCRSLAHKLQTYGIDVWIDDTEMTIGRSLTRMIRDALDNVDCVVAVLSRASIDSEWVRKELDIAMNREIRNRRILVLPVVIDDCALPDFLEGKYYADYRKPWRRRKATEDLVRDILSA